MSDSRVIYNEDLRFTYNERSGVLSFWPCPRCLMREGHFEQPVKDYQHVPMVDTVGASFPHYVTCPHTREQIPLLVEGRPVPSFIKGAVLDDIKSGKVVITQPAPDEDDLLSCYRMAPSPTEYVVVLPGEVSTLKKGDVVVVASHPQGNKLIRRSDMTIHDIHKDGHYVIVRKRL